MSLSLCQFLLSPFLAKVPRNTILIMLTNCLLFIFAIPVIEGLGIPWKLDNSLVGERIMKTILKSCYEDNNMSNPTITVGDFNGLIDESTTLRLNGSFNVSEHGYEKLGVIAKSNFKASKFIIVEDSYMEINNHLRRLKSTQWWNHMASFFIIGRNETCSNFKEILITMWWANIINAIYICADSMNSSSLYTLNPVSNYAPQPWESRPIRNVKFFHQTVDKNISCESLNYDKTRRTTGLIVRVMASSSRKFCNPDENLWPSNAVQSHIYNVRLIHAIVAAFNGTIWLECRSSRDEVIKAVYENSVDMTFSAFEVKEYPKISFLYPHYWSEILAIVNSSPEESTLHKILHLWSQPVLILGFIAISILFLILVAKNHDFSAAMLDLIRLLTYTSILINWRSHSFRIYFTTMLIFMIINDGVFRGKIASFLTTKVRIEQIETIDVLVQLGYSFHTTYGLATMVRTNCPKCQLKLGNYRECLELVENSTRNACLIDKFDFEYYYSIARIESVKRPFINAVGNLKCRDNWPFHDRVDDNLMRLSEAGLLNFWLREEAVLLKHKREVEEAEWSSSEYRPVQLAKLAFAFALLAAGLALSTFVFFIELFVRAKNCGGRTSTF